MASIQTSIMMADNISATLHNISNALNVTSTAFQGVQDAASNDIDVSAFTAIRENINAATTATQQFQDELDNVKPKTVSVEVAPVWNTESRIDIFQNTGIDRLNLEMGSLKDQTNEILASQQRIGEQALSMNLLPPNASWDINATNQRIEELGQKIAALQEIDVSTMDGDSVAHMNAEYESMRQSMNNVVNLQADMNTAIEQGDLSRLNEGYNQLNAIAEQVEQKVRSNAAAIEEMGRIEWKTPQNVEVFNSNGIDRYKQEIQSANAMLNQLTQQQQRIGQQASGMKILPPQALNDINTMGSRVQALRGQIEQVQKTRIAVVGVEQANAELEQLRQQLSNAVQVQEQMNTAIDNMDVSAANQAYNQLNSIVTATERNIRDNTNEQQNFNNEIRNGESAAGGLKGAIAAAVGAFTVRSGVKWVQDSLDLTNQQIQAEQQLANVLANQGATEADFVALKQQAAAIQGTSMYGATAMTGAAAELSTYMSDAEALKSMMGTVANYAAGMSGGAEVSYQQMVEYATQLGKALDGTYDGLKKKGFELSDAQKAIIDCSSFEELAKEGVHLSAEYEQLIQDNYDLAKAMVIDEVISQSWAGLAEQMAQTPQGVAASMANTFNDIRSNIGAQLLPALMMVFAVIQGYMPRIEQMLYGMVPAIQMIIGFIGNIIDAAFGVYQFFSDNWSMIAPIIFGIAAALAVYHGAVLAINIVNGIAAAIEGAKALATNIQLAATAMATGATFAQTAAQWGLNAALLACPLTWIVLAIIALIAIVYLVVAAVNQFAGTSVSATGIVFGAFTFLGAFLWNLFLGLLELVLGVINYMVNPFINFANFIGNVFTSPVSSIIYLFQDMADTVLGLLEKIASALDFIFGSNMAGAVAGWRSGLKSMANGLVAEYAPNEDYQRIMDTLDLSVDGLGLKRWAYSDAWDAGYSAGENLDSSIGDMFNTDAANVPTASDYVSTNFDGQGQMGGIADDTANIASNTKAIKDTGEEDLKYLRDIAEREVINRFTTAEVHVDFGGVTNNVDSSMDLDGVIDYLSDGVREALEVTAEGVYA